LAIDRMKKATILLPASRRDDLLAELYAIKLFHVAEASKQVQDEGHVLSKPPAPSGRTDEIVAKLSATAAIFDRFAPRKQRLVENFFDRLPHLVRLREVEEIAGGFDWERICARAARLAGRHADLAKEVFRCEQEIASLAPFLPLEPPLRALAGLRRVRVLYGRIAEQGLEKLRFDAFLDGPIAIEEAGLSGRSSLLLAAGPAEKLAEIRKRLAEYGFEELELPDLAGTAAERTGSLRGRLSELRAEQGRAIAEIKTLAGERVRVEVLLAWQESQRRKARAAGETLASARIALVVGYVRERDLGEFESLMAERFPQAQVALASPSPTDNVPVSITLGPILKPLQLFINMFGLPSYFSFDPTPFLSVSFLVFFGFCFSDVLYGTMLITLCIYMMRKYRLYPGVRSFFHLFLYAGIATVAFGVISGSWGGNLYEYLGEGNVFKRIAQRTMLIDPIGKATVVLGAAIALGVLNQFYGLVLKGYGALLRRDYVSLVGDSIAWLVLLGSLLVGGLGAILGLGPAAEWGALGAGAVAVVVLLFTQGRGEKTFIGKAVVGVVSLYGIVGGYGVAAFVGDILSYSRLLALGLTTAVIAWAFNQIASLFMGVTVANVQVGIAIFALLAALGHVFNFAVSILGSFVHPARLVLLEFFCRFYEGGGERFAPLGFESKRVRILSGP